MSDHLNILSDTVDEIRDSRVKISQLQKSMELLEARVAAHIRANGPLKWDDAHMVDDGRFLAWGGNEVTLEGKAQP